MCLQRNSFISDVYFELLCFRLLKSSDRGFRSYINSITTQANSFTVFFAHACNYVYTGIVVQDALWKKTKQVLSDFSKRRTHWPQQLLKGTLSLIWVRAAQFLGVFISLGMDRAPDLQLWNVRLSPHPRFSSFSVLLKFSIIVHCVVTFDAQLHYPNL